ncbi:hypothetical protein [Bacillus sp. CBEL-1]|uniref:phage tail protein n=1 Tax=Bacillus sp. CBEL-1 TaxID=2502980 RepID=UPI00104F4E0C|nr:hypothetical protein [Bacillus sp. CBEL-1]TDB51748.1 hypothetical protein EPL02_08345 [Bacillus sp. CBEL-1]
MEGISFTINAIDNFSRTMDSVTSSVDRMTDNFSKASTHINDFGSKMREIGEQGVDYGENLAQSMALPVAALGALAIQSALTTSEGKALGEKFTSAFKEVQKALAPVGVIIMQIASEYLPPLVAKVQELSKWFQNLSPTTQKVIVALGAFMIAIGPVVMVVAGLVMGLGGLAGVFGILASPIALIVAAVAALAAGLIYLYNANETFHNAVLTGWQMIKDKAVEVFGMLMTIISPAFEAVKTFVMTKLNEIKAFWDQHGAQIMMAVQNAFTAIQTIVMGAFAILTPIIQAAWEVIKVVFQTAWDLIKAVVDLGLNVIMGLVKVFTGLLTGDFTLMWDGIKQITSAAWKFLESIVDIGINFVSGIVKTGLNLIKTTFTTIWEAVKTKVSEVWESIKTKVKTAVDNVKTSVENGFEKLKSAVDTKMNAAKDKIEDVWAKIEAFFEGIDLFQIGKDIIQGLIDGIGSMASAAITKASELAGEIKDTIAGAFKVHSPSRWMRDMIGKNLLIGFQIGLDKERRSTLSKVADMTRWMTPAMPTIPQTDTRTPYAATRAPQQQQVIYLTVSNNFDGDDVWNAVESRNAAAYIMNNALRGK